MQSVNSTKDIKRNQSPDIEKDNCANQSPERSQSVNDDYAASTARVGFPINYSTSTSTIASKKSAEKNEMVSEQSNVYWDLSTARDSSSNEIKKLLLTMQPRPVDESQKYIIHSKISRCTSLESPLKSHIHRSELSVSTADISPAFNSITESDCDKGHGAHSNSVIYTTEKILPARSKKKYLGVITKNVSQNECKTQPSNDLLKNDLDKAEEALKIYLRMLAVSSASKADKAKVLNAIQASIERAWSLPSVGRDLAYKLCDVLRTDGGIDIILEQLTQLRHHKNHKSDRDLLLGFASVLSQSMTVPNREYVASCPNGLDTIVSTANEFRDDKDITKAALGILECLFKHKDNTCKRLINCGGLDSVLYACRFFDATVLRHCAVALANLSLYGDEDCQQSMIARNAPEWLFPLAFSEDEGVKYYAFLAIAALGANKSLEQAVTKSGTLHLIEPFLRNRDPVEFGTSDRAHMHGHAIDWLTRLVPLLSSKRVEVQSLAAFHFAMEAAIRNRQGKLEIFKEINVIEPLKQLSRSSVKLASKFSNKALEILGEIPANSLFPQVMLWNVEDICLWMRQNEIKEEVIQKFIDDKMDADLLLQLTDDELRKDYKMERAIDRRRFFRELNKLKQIASYDACDIVHSSLDDFLKDIGQEFRQYSYQMSKAGVDMSIIKLLNDEHLALDCDITNGIHRLKIMEAAKKVSISSLSPYINLDYKPLEKNLDVFISYRRSNGSQLASLLKVHLQLRGFTVFLDIEKLAAGKFDESLITSIRSSKNFILVLTPNSLDRCIGDLECKDWIHKEVVAALNGGCNIIPVIDDFQFPPMENLPDDMKNISHFNGIRWIHDYQDACVDKLEQFITGNIGIKRTTNYPRHPLSKAGSACSPTPEAVNFQPDFGLGSSSAGVADCDDSKNLQCLVHSENDTIDGSDDIERLMVECSEKDNSMESSID